MLLLLGCNETKEDDAFINHNNEEDVMDIPSLSIQFERSGYINFQFIESHKVDASGVLDYLRINDIAIEKFTWFEQFVSIEDMHNFSNRINFELPNFELNPNYFEDQYFVLTIGRELVEIQYEYLGEPPWTLLHLVQSEITLSEQYSPDILYLYATDPIRTFPSDLSGIYNAFFFIQGDERVYQGQCAYEINRVFDYQR